MKRIVSDWNNIRPDGTFYTHLDAGQECPDKGEWVWSIDSGERARAAVIGVEAILNVDTDEIEHNLWLDIDRDTVEDDPEDTL